MYLVGLSGLSLAPNVEALVVPLLVRLAASLKSLKAEERLTLVFLDAMLLLDGEGANILKLFIKLSLGIKLNLQRGT